MTTIHIDNNSVVDCWNNGDGTVAVVLHDRDGKEVELVFHSSSVLGRVAKAADRARDYLKLLTRPPQIYGS